jgi:hypothetical protein
MVHDSGRMMSEAELRKELDDLEKFWSNEVRSRAGTEYPVAPVDCFWYIYTRQAYLTVLGERVHPGKPLDAETKKIREREL